ncbi:hypothetical protein BJY04DRAFT_186236 [Aspergillus karnatakaensis]|uniref:uncharacterized protein n=1 Tax=Aspergillus karnatakaensis TaxID=1810916 RepID=UPI003CCDCCED
MYPKGVLLLGSSTIIELDRLNFMRRTRGCSYLVPPAAHPFQFPQKVWNPFESLPIGPFDFSQGKADAHEVRRKISAELYALVMMMRMMMMMILTCVFVCTSFSKLNSKPSPKAGESSRQVRRKGNLFRKIVVSLHWETLMVREVQNKIAVNPARDEVFFPNDMLVRLCHLTIGTTIITRWWI